MIHTFAFLLSVFGLLVGAAVAVGVVSYGRYQDSAPMRRGWTRRARMVPAPLVTAATFYGLTIQYGREPMLLAISVAESVLLIALLFVDLDLSLIPILPVGAFALLALASAGLWPGLSVGSALLGGAIGFAVFGVLVALGHRFWGAGALGLGDAYLALAIGCLTGYPLVVSTLMLGIILGGVWAGAALVLRRGGLRAAIPYAPPLIAAALVVLIHGNTTHPFL